MNVLIPMAGNGIRFREVGYKEPKPMIDVAGKPMIEWVIESLDIDSRHIFIVQKKHNREFEIEDFIKGINKCYEVIELDEITEGAACTTLIAEKYISGDEDLIIANSDQYIRWDFEDFLESSKNVDGSILIFDSNSPKHSYARVDDSGYVKEVAEKKVISNNATIGVYYWKSGSEYVRYAKSMITKNIRTNNEFYICPVYNEAIIDKKKISTYSAEMWGMGTPDELYVFLREYCKINPNRHYYL
jgi:NDP-sugar pyrophosphorylase family protein